MIQRTGHSRIQSGSSRPWQSKTSSNTSESDYMPMRYRLDGLITPLKVSACRLACERSGCGGIELPLSTRVLSVGLTETSAVCQSMDRAGCGGIKVAY